MGDVYVTARPTSVDPIALNTTIPQGSSLTSDFLQQAIDAQGAGSGGASPAPAAPATATSDLLQQAIDGKLKASEPAKAKPLATPSSIVANTAAGANESIADVVGAPVDLIAGAINLGIRGLNAASGANIPQATAPVGGSQSIKNAFGVIGANPDAVAANQPIERIARGIGGGAAAAIAPEVMLSGLGAAGLASLYPKTAQFFSTMFGGGGGASQAAGQAAIGAAAGGTGEGAAEVAPEPLKPTARLVGNLVGGAGGAAATELPGVAAAGYRAAGDYIAPMTTDGQKLALAQRMFSAGVNDRSGALDQLRSGYQGVGGVSPTAYQATGDAGIGAMERESETAEGGVGPFNAQRAAQNEARVGLIRSLQPTGDPAAVGDHIRDQLDQIDQMTAGIGSQATQKAQEAGSGIGGAQTPEALGNEARGHLTASNDAAKARERSLWGAVDPDGTLALPADPVISRAASIAKSMPSTAKPPSGEEAAILSTAANLPKIAPFGDITALRSRISTAMRQELMTGGQSPTYARLAQLRGAVEDAISAAAAHKSAADEVAVASGDMAVQDSLRARIDRLFENGWSGRGAESGEGAGGGASGASAAGATGIAGASREGSASGGGLRGPAGGQGISGNVPEARASEGAVTGPGKVYYPSGALNVRYEVANLPDLVTSHDANFNVNRNYPAALQPRARETAPARDQVNAIAGRLQPERLGPSPEANSGAPIVGPDNVVESGNGRVLALSKAYQAGRSADYRNWLAAQGVDTKGLSQPVLIARRTTPLSPEERVAFAHSANTASGLRMNAVEQAAADARLITPESLGSIADGSPINGEQNRSFVRSFLSQLPASERGGMLDANGSLSQAGVRRIEAAMASRAYGDSEFVAKAFDAADPNIRGIAGALTDAAPAWMKMRQAAREGSIDAGHDVTPELMNAVRAIIRARDAGRPVAEVLNQGDMFGGEASNLAKGLVLNDKGQIASREQVAARLQHYATEAQKNAAGPSLFGDTVAPSEVLRTALKNDGVPELASEALKPGPVANFDAAAAERLRAASAATKERAATFKSGPVGEVLAEKGNKGDFRLLDSGVGAKFWKAGPGGAEAVKAYGTATGNAPDAVRTLENIAGLSLRRAAMREDGTLDPGKYQAWATVHQDALRGLGNVSPAGNRFADAAKASEAVADSTAMRAAALDAYQKTAVAPFLKAVDAGDVTRQIGNVFGSKNAIANMRQLATTVRDNPDARDGLRKGIADYISNRFIGNTEQVKSDTFHTFLKNNKPVLAQVFSHDELKGMDAVASELSRYKQLSDLQALPGRSTTAQDTIKALEKAHEGGHSLSLFSEMLLGANLGAEHGGVQGAITGAAGAFVKNRLTALRATGMGDVRDLVREMLLNPPLARAALEAVGPEKINSRNIKFTQQLNRVAAIAAQRMIGPAPRPSATGAGY
jgi:hypothetical protein